MVVSGIFENALLEKRSLFYGVRRIIGKIFNLLVLIDR